MYLKQSTASQAILIGPFLDTDGVAVTGLTIDAADVRLSKNGANIVGKNSGGATHDELGYYTLTLDATDTDTVGRLQLTVTETGALNVYHEFQVVEEVVFDALFGASALGYVANAAVNVAQFGGSNLTASSGIPSVNTIWVSGDSTAADNLETAFDDTAGAVPWTGIIDQGTAQSVTATTVQLRAGAAFANDEVVGATLVITSATTGAGQSRVILDYVGATDTATVDTFVTTPTGTVNYKLIPTAANSTATPIPVNVIQVAGSAVDTAVAQLGVNVVSLDAGAITATAISSDAITAGKIADGAIDAATFAANAITSTVLAADAITAAKLAADVTTELQSGLATAANLATVDTVVDAIKVKTDSLTFTVANSLDSNIQHVNDIAVTGDGETGTEWGPV